MNPNKDDILKPIQPCVVVSEQHGWLPTTGKGMQCFSCPMCKQRIYWSETSKSWVKVTAREQPLDQKGILPKE